MKECPSCHTDLNLKRHEFERHQKLCQKYQLHIDKLDNGKFECQDCRREFQSMKSIFAHLSKVHFKEFFARQLDSKCNNCDQRYNKRSFKKHKKLCGFYSMHITHVDGKWACNFCGQLAVDGAFGSYSEASGGRLASLAYTPQKINKIFP